MDLPQMLASETGPSRRAEGASLHGAVGTGRNCGVGRQGAPSLTEQSPKATWTRPADQVASRAQMRTHKLRVRYKIKSSYIWGTMTEF